jgi:hypothetical protein
MDAVFKYYNVYDDVANIIAFQVHRGYQKEINKRIKIMVGFDWNYNYWNGNKTKNEIPKPALYIWMDKEYSSLDCNELSITEYSYMCNSYKVFSLNHPLRRNLFIIEGNQRLIEEIEDKKNELLITQLINSFNNNTENINFLERTAAFLECKYTDWQNKALMLSSINLINNINNISSINNINNIKNLFLR